MLNQTAATREQPQVNNAIDERVIIACQNGDRDALRVLFEEYKDQVYSTAFYWFSGDAAAAADVTQQVFLKLISRINQFRGDSEFTTWLYRLVVNACLDERRKQRRLVSLTDLTLMKTSTREPSQNVRYAQHEISEHVHRAIAKLSPKLRVPILLKYVEGLSYEEIAEVLRCSKGTVASRLNRGHKALAKRLAYLRDAI
jgi:RNA polymerase sigma-70 factor, ECF subfamily